MNEMLFLDFFLNFYFVNHDEATFKCVPIEGLFTFLQFMVYFFLLLEMCNLELRTIKAFTN